jgi:type IV pilus assembly protein PilW
MTAPACIRFERRRRVRTAEAGVGLVEVLVSITIGLVIIAALVGLFLGTSRNNREMATANSMIENGRFAIAVLEEDILHGGFLGPYVPDFDNTTSSAVPVEVPTAVPNPCTVYASWDADFVTGLLAIPVQAYESNAFCTSVVTDAVADSDVVVVRHAETCVSGTAGPPVVPGDPGCADLTDNRLYLQATQCATETGTTRLLTLLGDATDVPATFGLHKRDCTTMADLRRFLSHIYYVRDYAVTAGDGIPTLVRAELDTVSPGTAPTHQTPVPLVEGVDAIRIEFGIDDVSRTGDPVDYTVAIDWEDPDVKTSATNRGDAIPDGDYVRCTTLAPCTVDQLMNVTSVKLWVLARSREETRGYRDTKTYELGTAGTVGPFDDAFKRHVYTATIRLPNVAGRRERP